MFHDFIKKINFLFNICLIFLIINTDIICMNNKINNNVNDLENLLNKFKNNNYNNEIGTFIKDFTNNNSNKNTRLNLSNRPRNNIKLNSNIQNPQFSKNSFKNLDLNNLSQENSSVNPGDIIKLNHLNDKGKNIDIDLKQTDPLKFMKIKEEVMNLYLNKNTRFKEKQLEDDSKYNDPYGEKQNPVLPPAKDKEFLTTKPSNIGKNGDPVYKEYRNDEEVVKISKVDASSVYKETKKDGIELYRPDRILADGEKFWCSEGNHSFYENVKFYIIFPKSYRLNAMWIHWAFAPAEFKIAYSNKEDLDKYTNFELISNGFQKTVKQGDMNWWKSVLSNSKTRWKYKSFDQRIEFDEPIWARIIEITMRMPVNQYYGIYKLEFYTKSKEIVMLKSKKQGEDLCLTVVNGQLSNFSPVVALDCLQAISYGDNRDLFILNSNGYITTFRGEKCLESSNANRVDILECGLSSQYKDEREKWILEFDGKIRSSKEEFTCLSVSDMSVGDEIPSEDMKVSSSSNQSDGLHDAAKAVSDDVINYWASNPSIGEVVFEIYFHKYSYIARDMNIFWKFPAKSYKIIGLYPDGYWKVFKKSKNNRDDTSYVNLMNKDLMGIKIVMIESTTKIEDNNVYGIKNISIHTGTKYLRRDPCKDILLDANKFEIISVNILDKVTGDEFKKSKANLHQTRTKLKVVESMYQKVPDSIIRMKEVSTNINEKLNLVSNSFSDIKNRLKNFSKFLEMESMKIFTLAANEYFPAMDCAHIIKAFPSKRSGMYWIKNECMPKSLQVFCDFDSYEKKGGLDYYIFNDNQPINTPFKNKFRGYLDIRYKCNLLGLEPLEIKNDKMINTIYNLLRILKYDLNTDIIIPLAYDYNCDVSKCANLFKPFNDINSGDITDLLNSFIKENGKNINYLFSSGFSGDPNIIRNVAAFGKLNNVIFEKLDSSKVAAIICSTNKDGKKSVKNYIDIDCDSHLRTDAFSTYEIFSNLRMICPSDCAKVKAGVYGSGIYTDNSSLCRAAIHSGALIDSEGGIIEVRIEPGKKNYLSSTKHNVETLDFPSMWDRSFNVSKYNPYCPIDKMKEYTEPSQMESFMELDVDSGDYERGKMDVYNLIGNSNVLKNLLKNSNNENNNFEFSANTDENKSEEIKKELEILSKLTNNNNYNKNLNIRNNLENKNLINRNNYENKIINEDNNLNKNNLEQNDSNKNNLKKLLRYINTNTNDLNNNQQIKSLNLDNNKEDFSNSTDEEQTSISTKQSDKSKKVDLVNQIEYIIMNYKNKLNSYSKSEKNQSTSKEVVDKLGLLSRFLQEDLSNKMKFHEGNQNTNSEKSENTESSNIDPDLLEKLYNISANSVNKDDFIKKTAKRIQANAIKSNNSGSHMKMRLEIMKKLSEIANESEESQKFKNILGFSGPVSTITTQQSLKYINAAFTKEENNLKQIKKVAEDFKTLIGKAISEIGLLNTDKDLGIDPQKNRLKSLEKKTLDINKIIFEIDKKIQNKIRRTEFNLKVAKYKISKFMIRNEFTETYNDNIFSVYSLYNSKKGKGKPSKWEYYPYNINGHFKVIKQENSFMDSRSGSNLILKDRDFYDFELKCSFFLKDNNTFGIAFRYVDPYNYYIFEVSNQEKGFKRIRKFVKGIPKVIDFKNDGGFIQETWYNVKIRAQQSKISIYMTDRTGDNMDKLYEMQFNVIDNELVHGSIAFSSYGMSFMLLDNISVVPIQCTNFDDSERDKQIAVTPTCPRFFENFKNGFSERWKTVDPKDFINGPSIWKVESDVEYRELVLKQSSKIFSSSDNQEGTMYVLTDAKKECNLGKFSVKFKALDEGIVGLIFRFEKAIDDGYNFYILELSGDSKDKFIRIRKKVNNQYSLVSVNPLVGYKKNTWIRLSLTIENDKFNAFISEDSSPDNVVKVFQTNAIDNDLKYGTLGISAYKTRLIMDEIVISPFDNLDDYDPDKTLFVDQEVLDCKIYFFIF